MAWLQLCLCLCLYLLFDSNWAQLQMKQSFYILYNKCQHKCFVAMNVLFLRTIYKNCFQVMNDIAGYAKVYAFNQYSNFLFLRYIQSDALSCYLNKHANWSVWSLDCNGNSKFSHEKHYDRYSVSVYSAKHRLSSRTVLN